MVARTPGRMRMQVCKATEGLSSCWDGTSAAPAAHRASPAALALALLMTLGGAGRLTWHGRQR